MEYLEFAGRLWDEAEGSRDARKSLRRALRRLGEDDLREVLRPAAALPAISDTDRRVTDEGLREIHESIFEDFVRPLGDQLSEGPVPRQLRPFLIDKQRATLILDVINSLVQYQARVREPDAHSVPPMLLDFHLRGDPRIDYSRTFVTPFRESLREWVFLDTGVTNFLAQSLIGAEALRYLSLTLDAELEATTPDLYSADAASHYRALSYMCRDIRNRETKKSGRNRATGLRLLDALVCSLLRIEAEETDTRYPNRFKLAVISKMAHIVMCHAERTVDLSLRRATWVQEQVQSRIDPGNSSGFAEVLASLVRDACDALESGEDFTHTSRGALPAHPPYYTKPRFRYWGAGLAEWMESILATDDPGLLRRQMLLWLMPLSEGSAHVPMRDLSAAFDVAFTEEIPFSENEKMVCDTEYGVYWALTQELPTANVADFFLIPAIAEYLQPAHAYRAVSWPT